MTLSCSSSDRLSHANVRSRRPASCRAAAEAVAFSNLRRSSFIAALPS
jgi:hypothetical protein